MGTLMAKESAFRIRVEADLHRDFMEACKLEGKPAAQIIREYMREFVRDHHHSMQHDLFSDANSGQR